MTEAELAAHVVAWLQEQRWTVHEEVYCGAVADIVAVMGRRIWVIEVKRTMGLAVMAQADNWRRWVHWVSVATPTRKRYPTHYGFERSILADRGIGHLEVDERYGDISIRREAEMLRRPDPHWLAKMREALVPGNAAGSPDGARAGAAHGGYWTPWKETCRSIRRKVAKRPGVTLKELLDAGNGYHYSSIASARSALSTQLREGAIPGVRVEKHGLGLHLFLDDSTLQSEP
jgi:hypothetical protein